MRASKARAGRTTGKACPRRWIAYDTLQGTWPNQRLAVKHPRQEPDAGISHVRICAEGAQQ
jgi:hypothetical protein